MVELIGIPRRARKPTSRQQCGISHAAALPGKDGFGRISERVSAESSGERGTNGATGRCAKQDESIWQLRDLKTALAGIQKRRHLHGVHRLADFSPMPNPLQSLLHILAQATERELIRHVQFLKAENQILRARLPERIVTTPAE